MKKIYLLVICIICITYYHVNAQLITIENARTQTAGDTVTIAGVVTNGAEFGTRTRYMQDVTAGVALYGAQDSLVKRGDSVIVTGTIAPFDSLIEIDIISLAVVSSNHSLPTPHLVTITGGFAAHYESQLIRINSVEFTTSGTFAGASTYYVKSGADSGEIYLYAATPLASLGIPSGNFDIVGIMGHYNSIYQLLPRDTDDFLPITTDINNLENTGNDIATYPNPAKDYINVESNFKDNTKISIELVDITGRVVKSWRPLLASSKMQLNVEDISSGLYLVNVISEGNSKILKQVISK